MAVVRPMMPAPRMTMGRGSDILGRGGGNRVDHLDAGILAASYKARTR